MILFLLLFLMGCVVGYAAGLIAAARASVEREARQPRKMRMRREWWEIAELQDRDRYWVEGNR